MNYADFYRRSIEQPQEFWGGEASRIHWETPYTRVLDDSQAPLNRWFVGGRTNLCYNAVDRWAQTQPGQAALIAVSTEVSADGEPVERIYSCRELQAEVERMSAIMLALGVGRGDRVLIYMPMIAEAVFAMLACARIGAVHSVVFGGFASNSLATRIDDAQPRLVVSADAGSRSGKRVPYKPLLDEAIRLASHKPATVLLVDRGMVPMDLVPGRDVDYAALREQHIDAQVPVTWLESNEMSYILYTSGTTGKPKGVQRDVGGYAVALASSMQHIFGGAAGETFFATSDIGWVVGHSYIVYGPLLAGMATVMYEGLPTRPDGGIWWRLVEKYRVTRMFSAPTAIRVLRKQPQELMDKHDLSSLKALYLAGEPLDETTSAWIQGALGVPVIDNYWQTETGWPILSIARAVDDRPTRLGSPGVPMPGYKVKVISETSGEECAGRRKGRAGRRGAAAAGLHADGVRRRRAVRAHLLVQLPAAGLFDVRLGHTRRRRLLLHPGPHRRRDQRRRPPARHARDRGKHLQPSQRVAEVAVVGVEDKLKGQVAIAFVIPRHNDGLAGEARARRWPRK